MAAQQENLAPEQCVTLASLINVLEGVGPQAVELFNKAGFFSIKDLKDFDGADRVLNEALGTLQAEQPDRPAQYWNLLCTRCINIIHRAQNAMPDEFVPDEFMCRITHGYYDDPVVTPCGISYSRLALETHLNNTGCDPITKERLPINDCYRNFALIDAVAYYRLNNHVWHVMC
jgi:hypothetical protein